MNAPKSHDIETIVRNIKASAVEVFNEIGPGHSDSVYDACLRRELAYQSIAYYRITSMPFFYKGDRIDDLFGNPFLIVENAILVEVNGFTELKKFDDAIMLNYLEQVVQKTAIVINFNMDDPSKLFKRIDLKTF